MGNITLNNEQLDALREIANVGGGNAATALSQLLGKKVSIDIPQVKLLSLDRISGSEFMIGPEEITTAVSLKILGIFKGGMLVLFSQQSTLLLVDILLHRKVGSTELLSLMDTSALSEVSHILCSSYLNAVGELLAFHQLIPSYTQIMVDKMQRLYKLLIEGFMASAESYILPIENLLIVEGIKINLFVTFLLEYESVKKILGIVGL